MALDDSHDKRKGEEPMTLPPEPFAVTICAPNWALGWWLTASRPHRVLYTISLCLSSPLLAAAPAVARPPHRPTAALGDLRAIVGGEDVRGSMVVPAAGDTAQADESGQDGVVGGLGLGGLPGEHSL